MEDRGWGGDEANAQLIVKEINDLLSACDEMYEESEPRPTAHAINLANRLIREARGLVWPDFPRGSLSAFDGSVRITWGRPDRAVRLVCPAAHERVAYVYHEEIRHGRSENYDIQEATGENLARWLRWLNARD